MPRIIITLKNFPELKLRIKNFVASGGKMKSVWQLVAPLLLRSVDKNFRAGGRPDKWQPSKKPTGKTLIKSGVGKSSINARAFAKGIAIGTPSKYMAAHDAGARIPAHTIKPKKAGGVLAFKIGGKLRFAKSVHIPSFKLPQRKFLLVQAEDWSGINSIIFGYFDERWAA